MSDTHTEPYLSRLPLSYADHGTTYQLFIPDSWLLRTEYPASEMAKLGVRLIANAMRDHCDVYTARVYLREAIEEALPLPE